MTELDLQHWSREVAEDPGAASFVHLARAYRRQGRRSAARDLVLGGLEANPEHVEGHALLALLHIDEGERERARDEWETVLRLDPGNFDASRGLGFLALERNDLPAARRHLGTAARARPDDPAVSQALQVLDRRERESRQPEPEAGAEPEASPARPEAGAPGDVAAATPGPEASTGEPPDVGTPGRRAGRDPLRLFESLAGEAPFRGALLLDDQGLVLGGRLEARDRQGDLLGALLNTAVSEAERTAEVLRLGPWDGMLLETDRATLHLTSLEDGAVLVLVAEGDAPAGWVMRTARRARALAETFLEGGE